MLDISQLLIPGVKLQKLTRHINNKGREYEYSQYFIYIPRDFEAYVKDKEWLVTIIVDSKEFPIGIKSPSRHNNYYIITLPNDLEYYWERKLYQKVDVLLQRP
jgi:hypothetical protein